MDPNTKKKIDELAAIGDEEKLYRVVKHILIDLEKEGFELEDIKAWIKEKVDEIYEEYWEMVRSL